MGEKCDSCRPPPRMPLRAVGGLFLGNNFKLSLSLPFGVFRRKVGPGDSEKLGGAVAGAEETGVTLLGAELGLGAELVLGARLLGAELAGPMDDPTTMFPVVEHVPVG
eukprot:scaffold6155_cov108-Cylindrotheca_fusiformis.AAC.8